MVDLTVPADHRIKLKKSEKKDKYLGFSRELKKLWNMKMTIMPILIGALDTSYQRIVKGTGGFGNWTSGEHPNYIIENIKKSPWDLRRLAVTQTPVKDHQLKMMVKTPKE